MGMDKEVLRVVTASDKDNVGVRSNLNQVITREGEFVVVKTSRIKISRINLEIKPSRPDVIFLSASLNTKEEERELRGFINKLRKHVPNAKVVVHSREMPEGVVQNIGADGWINNTLAEEYIGQALKKIVSKD